MKKFKKLTIEEFKLIYSKVPRLCIDLIVKTRKGILLTKRDIPPYKGFWHTPGGTVLLREKIEEAIQRISDDEIGSRVKIKQLIGVMQFPPDEVTQHSVSIVYLVSPIKKELNGSWQAKDIRFFKKVPKKTIKEQADFLIKNKFLE